MKKAIVSTCCSNKSYGSVLQALALKETLKDIGCSSTIVRVDEKTAKKSLIFRLKSLLVSVYDVFIGSKKNKRLFNNDLFIDQHLDVIHYPTYEKLKENVPEADLYLSGSDQVWHPNLCNYTYMLDFVPAGKKKYSYAASMGKTTIPENKAEDFYRLVSAFDRISVRESDAAEVVSQGVDTEVLEHIDPTFLLEKDKWEKYEKPYPIKQPYILVFAIYWNEGLNEELKQLHHDTGIGIVTIQDGYRKIYSNKRVYDADVGNFLWLIHNANAVVTTSFHGVALSIIMNKLCVPIVNPKLPSRISSLITKLNYPEVSIHDIALGRKIDYSEINQHIQEESKKGICYLEELLTDE